jgi:hypothetical protein
MATSGDHNLALDTFRSRRHARAHLALSVPAELVGLVADPRLSPPIAL